MKMNLSSITETVHFIIRNNFKDEGNLLSCSSNSNLVMVDCTAGSGNDTIFLSEIGGLYGKVYAFDIQDEAINRVRAKIDRLNIENVVLICDSHERLDQYIEGQIDCAVFNLGYLPGSDRSITTRPDSTIRALESVLSKIKKEGLVTVVSYSTHPGGELEYIKLNEYLVGLNEKYFKVTRIGHLNSTKPGPVLFVIQKT